MKQQIAVYMRLSLEDVDKRTETLKDVSNSIAAQRLLITQFLNHHETLSALPRMEFYDDGFTGTNFDRPDFNRMMELTKHGQISCIVVKDLSRFGRDYLEVGDYLEHVFPFLGVRFISINDQYDSDKHKGHTIGIDVAFKNLIYDYYSKDLSKKVKSAMRVKQRKAQYVNTVPYGYKVLPGQKHQLVPDECTAPIVQRIFADMIAGKSATEIAKALNTEGVRTPSEYKGTIKKGSKSPAWTHTAIYNILDNIKYTGTMVNHTRESRFLRDKNQRRVPQEEWYVRENAHIAIVSQSDFDAAQAAVQRRRKTVKTVHDQSDRVYYCGHCGGKLDKQNGSVFACKYARYQENSPCEGVHWRKTDLEDVIFESLKRQIQITQVESSAAQRSSKERMESIRRSLSRLSKQLSGIDREKLSQYEAYRTGALPADKYIQQKDALSQKKAALKDQIEKTEAELEIVRESEKFLESRKAAVSDLEGFNEDELREHLYDAVEKILVFDAKTIQIIWKFDDLKAVQ